MKGVQLEPGETPASYHLQGMRLYAIRASFCSSHAAFGRLLPVTPAPVRGKSSNFRHRQCFPNGCPQTPTMSGRWWRQRVVLSCCFWVRKNSAGFFFTDPRSPQGRPCPGHNQPTNRFKSSRVQKSFSSGAGGGGTGGR